MGSDAAGWWRRRRRRSGALCGVESALVRRFRPRRGFAFGFLIGRFLGTSGRRLVASCTGNSSRWALPMTALRLLPTISGDCEHARATRPLLFENFHFLRCPKVSHGVLPGRICLFDHVLFSTTGDKEARCARRRTGASIRWNRRLIGLILYQKQRFDTINFHHGCMVFTCESCKFSPRLEPGNFHYA